MRRYGRAAGSRAGADRGTSGQVRRRDQQELLRPAGTSALKQWRKLTKYLEIKLTKEMEDIYNENYKMLLKEIENIQT